MNLLTWLKACWREMRRIADEPTPAPDPMMKLRGGIKTPYDAMYYLTERKGFQIESVGRSGYLVVCNGEVHHLSIDGLFDLAEHLYIAERTAALKETL